MLRRHVSPSVSFLDARAAAEQNCSSSSSKTQGSPWLRYVPDALRGLKETTLDPQDVGGTPPGPRRPSALLASLPPISCLSPSMPLQGTRGLAGERKRRQLSF